MEKNYTIKVTDESGRSVEVTASAQMLGEESGLIKAMVCSLDNYNRAPERRVQVNFG